MNNGLFISFGIFAMCINLIAGVSGFYNGDIILPSINIIAFVFCAGIVVDNIND